MTVNRNGTYPQGKAMSFSISDAPVTFNSCNFLNLSTPYSSAAIYADKQLANRQFSDLKIVNSNFFNNTANNSAGAI